MCVYVCVCKCVGVHACVHIVFAMVYLCVCVCTCVCVCARTHTCTCIYVCMYGSECVCINVYICMLFLNDSVCFFQPHLKGCQFRETTTYGTTELVVPVQERTYCFKLQLSMPCKPALLTKTMCLDIFSQDYKGTYEKQRFSTC